MRGSMAQKALRCASEVASSSGARRSLASVAKAPIASSSSSASSSSWKPPIATNTEPAYDEALRYIAEQQALYRQQSSTLKGELQQLPKGSAELREAEARWRSYEIASNINDPETRWRFVNDPDVPLSEPIFAHLREQTWRRKALPRILQRIQVMKVLPDVIPQIAPTVDLQVAFGQGTGIHDHGGEGGDVMTGCFVSADKTLQRPAVTATPFHADERFYSLALVDVDAPYDHEDRLGSKLLWLVHNVRLSLTQTSADLAAADEVMSYIPPHPARGSPYHRYALVLMEQPQRIEGKALIPSPDAAREHYSVTDLMARLDLAPAGIHFWRAVWSEESKAAISSVYADVLRVPEPHYARRS